MHNILNPEAAAAANMSIPLRPQEQNQFSYETHSGLILLFLFSSCAVFFDSFGIHLNF